MTEAKMVEWMSSLGPTDAQTERMEAEVLFAHEAAHTSLLAEWLGMFKTRPVLHFSYALAAAAVVLFLSTPLGSLSLALLK